MSDAISRSRALKLLEKKIDLYEGIVLIRPDLIALNQKINLICSYNLDDFLLIDPNLLLSKILNNSPINEIEKL